MRSTKAKKFIYPLLAMGLTITVIVIAMFLKGVYPFGDKTMLWADAQIQYVGFFGWLGEVLRGDANLFYSFSKSLGGGTFSLFAYYLSSPFNLLTYFFQPQDIPALFSLLIPLKLGIASLTMCIYLWKRVSIEGLPIVLISSSYGLAACNLVAGSNIMWLDGVIMLPLVCLGVWNSISKRKISLLVVAVAITVFSNWYSAYTVCLFSIIYFFAEAKLSHHTFKVFIFDGLRYASAMIVGLLLSLPLLLPVVLETISSQAASATSFSESVAEVWPFPQGMTALLRSIYMGWGSDQVSETFGLAIDNFPTASILLISTLFFFCLKRSNDKSKSISEYKIVYGVVVLFMLLSFTCKPLDIVWTAFNRSDSYNPRYMYILIFCLAVISAHSFKLLKELDAKAVKNSLLRTACILIAVVVYLFFDGWRPFVKALLLQGIIVLVLMLYMLLWSQMDKDGTAQVILVGDKSISVTAIVILLCGLLPFCGESLFIKYRQMGFLYENTSYRAFHDYVEELALVSNSASSPRMENTLTNSREILIASASPAPTGENLAVGMRGLSHYSSSGQQEVNDLLGNLGYSLTPGFRGIVYYNSPIYSTDLIFGVGNIIAPEQPFGYSLSGMLDMSSPSSGEEGAVYTNSEVLSLGFGVASEGESFAWDENPFINQERFISELTNTQATYYRPCEINEPDVSLSADRVTINIRAVDSGPMYVFLSSPVIADLYCNGAFLQTVGSWEYDTNIIYLGNYSEGERVTLTLQSDYACDWSSVSADARTLDIDAFENAFSVLSRDQLEIISWEDGFVSGNFNASIEEGLLLTIPYESEWAVKVDGQVVEPRNYQGLIYIPVSQGEHSIELTYGLPEGMTLGIGITLLTLVGCGAVKGISICRDKKSHM